MKITAEVYKNIKKGKAPVNLSKRTIRNVEKSKNYLEYRKKYVLVRKKSADNISDEISRCSLSLYGKLDDNYLMMKKFQSELIKLNIIHLIVTLVGISVLIAILAW